MVTLSSCPVFIFFLCGGWETRKRRLSAFSAALSTATPRAKLQRLQGWGESLNLKASFLKSEKYTFFSHALVELPVIVTAQGSKNEELQTRPSYCFVPSRRPAPMLQWQSNELQDAKRKCSSFSLHSQERKPTHPSASSLSSSLRPCACTGLGGWWCWRRRSNRRLRSNSLSLPSLVVLHDSR